MDPAVSTFCESGGQDITDPNITDDWDGQTRANKPGYVGTGTSSDVGADEFGGVTPKPSLTALTVAPTGNQCLASSRSVTVNCYYCFRNNYRRKFGLCL